jgi:tetratricopeptide (TPR) repeat protein
MIEQALALVDRVIYDRTGKHLNDLQATVLREVWQGKKYLEIADLYGCTEGHAKDAGYLLWKILSKAWGEKITKTNFRTAIKKRLQLVDYQINTAINPQLLDSNKEAELNFIGREQAISDLTTLVERGHKIIVIQGQGGIGKTTLAKKYLKKQEFDLTLEFLMAKETQNITSVESLIEEWLNRDFQEESGKEFGVTLARLKRHLEKRKVGILIDNLEPALDKHGQLIIEQRNYLELLRILADNNVKSVTLITSRDRFCEADINLHHYRLSGLSLTAWIQFFTTNQIPIIDSILSEIHYIYGGNAKAMGILCGVIKEDFAADLDVYWQENSYDPLTETDLKNLVTNQFNRLQKLDDQAYLLLCRLGCYRYQDIPSISQAGLLALLWELQANQKKRIIESLRNRSLIEFSQGNYWLHPVIKAEALSRLSSVEWQQVNQQIAQFYTESVAKINTIQDGLTALEAYYHYYAISDFTQAGKVILLSRSNQWGQHLTLGTHLYRLGLLQPLLQAITQIIDRITEPKIHSELNNILGDIYWISGKIKQAIICQESTIATAINHLNQITDNSYTQQDTYYWKMLQVDSLLSTGLYNIDLWELETATKVLQQVIEFASNTKHHSWAEKASICLALVYSYLDNRELAAEITNQFIQLINQEQNQTYNTGRFAYFMQILGQTLINLQQYEQAQTILQKAIAFSQSSHYVQIKAKALTGLGIIQRQNNNFIDAERYHQEAIQLLENIGAKCDLAEAYYQFAITLKKTDNITESQTYSAKAIELFQQIDAPKQVEKIS